MEVVPISRLSAHRGNHNPSQTTLGNFYIAACKKITMGVEGNYRNCFRRRAHAAAFVRSIVQVLTFVLRERIVQARVCVRAGSRLQPKFPPAVVLHVNSWSRLRFPIVVLRVFQGGALLRFRSWYRLFLKRIHRATNRPHICHPRSAPP